MCEQIKNNDDDIDLNNTAGVYNGCDDVYNNVPVIQQVVVFLFIFISVTTAE